MLAESLAGRARGVALCLLAGLTAGCPGKTYTVDEVCGAGAPGGWSAPRRVSVVNADGTPWDDDVEEPEVRDFGGARWLFFNDDPSSGNKDLFVARWDDGAKAFVVQGRLQGDGAQSPAVDGNPSLDQDGHFFFVSTRTYPKPTETIHEGTLTVSGSPPVATLSNVQRLDGLSRADTPWATQGVQVSWDGATLTFDEAKFGGPIPSASDLVGARRTSAGYERLPDAEQATLFGAVNTAFLEYAESFSRDGKTMFFTRTWVDAAQLSKAVMCVMVSTRADVTAPWGPAVGLSTTAPLAGAVMEAPSLSPDEQTLYYHRREPGEARARLWALDRR